MPTIRDQLIRHGLLRPNAGPPQPRGVDDGPTPMGRIDAPTLTIDATGERAAKAQIAKPLNPWRASAELGIAA